MNSKKWIAPAAASLLAFGTVSLGSSLETEAYAAITTWNYVEECRSGCSNEETDEFFLDGSYVSEVMVYAGTNNREEMLELTEHSQQWCRTMLTHMAYNRPFIYQKDVSCIPLRLGW